jgi:hypothetical protein
MGIKADAGGRNASLDDRKRRAAGRGKNASPERRAIQDASGRGERGRGAPASGAFGKQGQANRQGTKVGAGGGGGGADPKSRIANVRASRKTH